MATTINSTALDFTNIKANLKKYLESQTEFADYNFEASGLNNILDVLAYNTHINGLTSNFAINESFLGTAQLRSSVVSLATGIGYIPDSMTAAQGTINVTLDLSGVADRPATVSLPAFTKFTANIDDLSYTFMTKEVFSAIDNGTGTYRFKTSDDSLAIPIFEGTLKSKTFLVGATEDRMADAYIIPDLNMDADTVTVRVFESYGSNTSTVYTNITKATTINSTTTLYILKETPNGFYQLSFGGDGALGKSPAAGNAITVEYISTGGPTGNNAVSYSASDTITVGGVAYNLTPSNPTISSGGDVKESIESIRKNAPFQYATQNRMVTAEDYTSIILRNFSTLINDITSWGGEDNYDPKFGTVFTSIDFEDNVTADKIAETKTSIEALVDQLAVVSFGIEFADPIDTFIEVVIFYQLNPTLTSLSANTISTNINTQVSNYFNATLGKFERSFRRSNLLTRVDDVSPAVLSSRAVVRMQQRFTPTVNVSNSVVLTFPSDLSQPLFSTSPNEDTFVVRSSNFSINGRTCRIANEARVNGLGQAVSSTKLQVVDVTDLSVVVDNVGSYNPTTRTVNIVSFTPTALIGALGKIKISVLPANQSAVSPILNNILKYDQDESSIKSVTVDADN
jgi:hypothetical protein